MFRKLAKKIAPVLWLLPGFLLWASYPPLGEKMDSLFALAPLLWLARRGDARRSWRKWYANGLVFWIGTLVWMPAIVKNGGPWPLVALGWFALGAYCALYFGAFGFLSAKVWRWVNLGGYARRLLAILAVEPILWAGLELVRSRLFGGFAWNHLGTPCVNASFGAPAALGGVYLVSALVLLVNGTFASVAERMTEQFMRCACSGSSTSGVPRFVRSLETFLPLALVWLCFKASAPVPEVEPAGEVPGVVSVALVQRNFPCVFSGREENPVAAYATLLDRVAPLKPDLVVLPESALAEFGAFGSPSVRRFIAWAREKTGARGVLAGGVRVDGEKREYNSAAICTAQGDETYDKVHLVPFGEYIPGDKLFPVLQRFAPVGSCWPGELKTIDFEGIPIGVAICFEDTDSAQMRLLAEKGARVLAFVTNDAWFSHSVEAEQHAWQSVARAIETGLPVVRVGNSGVTGVIQPDGSAAWLCDAKGRPIIDRQGVMLERVALPAHARTPYVALDDAPLAAAFALILAVMAAAYALRFSLQASAECGIICQKG